MKRATLILSTVLLFFIIPFLTGCVQQESVETESDAEDRELEERIRRRAQVFEEARGLIAGGTPRSLDEGLRLLREEDLHTTEKGSELAFAGLKIRRVVYPYLENLDYEVSLPQTSIYDDLFSKVTEGVFPDIESEKADFITLLCSAITILTATEEKQYERAEEAVRQVHSINSESELGRYLRAVMLRNEGKEGEAEEIFISLSEDYQSCYPALIGAVEMTEKRGRMSKALPYAQILLQEYGNRRKVLNEVSRLYISLARYDSALDILNRGISAYPENTELLLSRALLLEHTGEINQAMGMVNTIERDIGEQPETLLVRSRIALDNTDFEKALSLAERGISRYPEIYDFSLTKAYALLESGRSKEAYVFLSERWEEKKWNMDLLSALLDIAVRTERWEEGEQYLLRLLDYNPDDFTILRSAVELYREKGDTEKAYTYAKKFENTFPQRRNAVSLYLELLLETERVDEARGYIEDKLEATESAEIRSMLFYYRSEIENELDAQIKSLQSALFENMQNVPALSKISRIYREQGMNEKAARYLRQAIAARPDDEELRERLRRIEAQD